MQFWNNIVNTALLGTDKKLPDNIDFPEPLTNATNTALNNTTIDREEQFLQLAAIAFNYRQCGIMPLQKAGVSITPCPEEDFPYCSAKEMQLLHQVLEIDSIALLQYWLKYCNALQKIVTPECIPSLFDKAIHTKGLREMITVSCGKRGHWLSGFNPDWQSSATASPEELWQTGTLAQRSQVLLQLRQNDPALAREWLQQTWSQENAATKQELLQVIAINSSLADETWLLTLLTEKSKLVKAKALDLLKSIPGTAILEQYWQIVSATILLKKVKNSLGIPIKKVLFFETLPEIPTDTINSGIEKLSNDKKLTDEEFIIFQLMQFIPLEKWEQYFNLSPEEIFPLFEQTPGFEKFIPAFTQAIARFKNNTWALVYMQLYNSYFIDLMPSFPLEQQEEYTLKMFKEYPEMGARLAAKHQKEWSLPLAQLVFKHAAQHPYQYNRQFFGEHILLIPVAISDTLDTYTAGDEYSQKMWTGIAVHILRLMSLKKEILKTFNA